MAGDPDVRSALLRAADEVRAFYEELNGDNPRAAAILAVASLEDQLERLIRTKFPNELSDKLWKKIAGAGFTPLSTLEAKADIAQAFGFYGDLTRSLIRHIAVVRNKFAHHLNVREFNHQLVIRECIKLNGSHILPECRITEDTPADDVRWAYIHTVEVLEARLSDIANHVPELGPRVEPLP